MSLYSSRSRNAWIGTSGFALLVFFLLYSLRPSTSSTLYLARYPSAQSYGPSECGILDNIFNRTLGFQKIFVVNLPSRSDSRDAMSLAAALTDLAIEYVDGVTEVENKTLPPGAEKVNLNKGSLNAWRAHMNVARMIVEQNITSALILEGDVDWDIRIKQQMRDFARAAHLLIQPLAGTTSTFLDPTHPSPLPEQRPQNFLVGNASATSAPTTSPYGDLSRWDLLWLGHCGARFPWASDAHASPLARAVLANDSTVPAPRHLDVELGSRELLTEYPPHTRVVHRARVNTCTLAYGLSQPGARRLLYDVGIKEMTGTNDMMFRSLCDGGDGRERRSCLTVQPQLFQHHRREGPKRAYSDINDFGDGWNGRAETRNVRWSTRLNFERLVDGRTDYVDLYADAGET